MEKKKTIHFIIVLYVSCNIYDGLHAKQHNLNMHVCIVFNFALMQRNFWVCTKTPGWKHFHGHLHTNFVYWHRHHHHHRHCDDHWNLLCAVCCSHHNFQWCNGVFVISIRHYHLIHAFKFTMRLWFYTNVCAVHTSMYIVCCVCRGVQFGRQNTTPQHMRTAFYSAWHCITCLDWFWCHVFVYKLIPSQNMS